VCLKFNPPRTRQQVQLYYFQNVDFVFRHFSFVLSAYLLAAVLYVCVETPFGNLVGLLRAKK